MTALELYDGGSPTFTFADDPDWVNALTDIELYVNGSSDRREPNVINIDAFDRISSSEIATGNLVYTSGVSMKWVFVANGYADIVVEVKIP